GGSATTSSDLEPQREWRRASPTSAYRRMRSMPNTPMPAVAKRLVALASRRCRGRRRLRRLEVAFLAVVFFTVAFFAVAFLAGPIPRSLPLLFDQIKLSPGHG